jgi:hypothetical protein
METGAQNRRTDREVKNIQIVSNPRGSSATQATAEVASHSIFNMIRSSPFVRSVVFLTMGAIGGGSVTGCSREERGDYKSTVEAQRLLTKEAKFSTFAPVTAVSLEQMEALLATRTAIAGDLEKAAEHVRAFVMKCEESRGVSPDALQQLKNNLEPLASALSTAQGSADFSHSKEKLKELSDALRAAVKSEVDEFKEDASRVRGLSPGYQKVSALQSSIFDWIHALERDVGELQKGVFAKSVAELATTIRGTENELARLVAQPDPVQWLAAHPIETALVRQHLSHSLSKAHVLKSDIVFSGIAKELSDAVALYGDLLDVIPSQSGAVVTQLKPEGVQALVKAAHQLSGALVEDLREELVGSLGVRPVGALLSVDGGSNTNRAANASTNPAAPSAAPSGVTAPTTVVHHHHSSGLNNFFMWHYLLNSHGGYYPHGGGYYSYVPQQSVSYSGSSRLRNSASYSAFSSTMQEAQPHIARVDGMAASSKVAANTKSASVNKSTTTSSAGHGEVSPSHPSKSGGTTASGGSKSGSSGGFGGSGSKGFGG